MELLELKECEGLGWENAKETSLLGMVFKLRETKNFSFALIQYEKDLFQAVIPSDCASGLCEGCAVELTGYFKAAKVKAKWVTKKNIEFMVKELEVLSSPAEAAPFSINQEELNIQNDVLFDNRMISLRHPKEKAVFEIQSLILRGIREYLYSQNFTEIQSPKLVAEGAEGGANIFSLEYFGKKAFLTQSPQFYKEFGTGIFGKVFEIGPVFRAEKHNTNRHLNEYTSVDFEMGPIKSFKEIMLQEVHLLKYIWSFLKTHAGEKLSELEIELKEFESIPSVKFSEAKEILKSLRKGENFEGEDMEPFEEKALGEYALKTWGSEFLFITHYPTTKRPFYTKNCEENPQETLSFDLLFKGLEITTGGQRIHSYTEIVEKMKSLGMRPEEFNYFLKAHKYGLPPHGGLGLGLERLTQLILGLESVKRARLFPRDKSRLTP